MTENQEPKTKTLGDVFPRLKHDNETVEGQLARAEALSQVLADTRAEKPVSKELRFEVRVRGRNYSKLELLAALLEADVPAFDCFNEIFRQGVLKMARDLVGFTKAPVMPPGGFLGSVELSPKDLLRILEKLTGGGQGQAER